MIPSANYIQKTIMKKLKNFLCVKPAGSTKTISASKCFSKNTSFIQPLKAEIIQVDPPGLTKYYFDSLLIYLQKQTLSVAVRGVSTGFVETESDAVDEDDHHSDSLKPGVEHNTDAESSHWILQLETFE